MPKRMRLSLAAVLSTLLLAPRARGGAVPRKAGPLRRGRGRLQALPHSRRRRDRQGHGARLVRSPQEQRRLGRHPHPAAPLDRRRQDLERAARASPTCRDRRRRTRSPCAVKNVRTDDVTYNNPVLIADRDGTVHLLFCLEYMRCFYQRSTDDGAHLEQAGRDHAHVREVPPGLRLESARDRARTTAFSCAPAGLIVPVWLSTGTGGNAHRPSVTATIYSDDQGKTWQARRHRRALHRRMDQSQRNRRHRTGRRPRDAQRPQRIENPSPPRHDQQGRRDRLEHAEVRRRPARTDLHGGPRSLLLRRARRQESHPVFQSAQPRTGRRQSRSRQKPRPQERLRQAQLRRRPDLGREQNRRSRLQRLQRSGRHQKRARSFASMAAPRNRILPATG